MQKGGGVIAEELQAYTVVLDNPQTKMSGDGGNTLVGGHSALDRSSSSPHRADPSDSTNYLYSSQLGYTCTGPCGSTELDSAELSSSSSTSYHSKTMNTKFRPNDLDGLPQSPDVVARQISQEVDIRMGHHNSSSSAYTNLPVMDSDSELSADDSSLKKKKKTMKKKATQMKSNVHIQFQEPASAYTNLSIIVSDSELSVDDPSLKKKKKKKKKKTKPIHQISTDSQNSSEVDTSIGPQEPVSTFTGPSAIDSNSELSTDDYALKKTNKKTKSKTIPMKPIPDVAMEIPLETDICMGPQVLESDTEHQADGSTHKKKIKAKPKTIRSSIEPSSDDESIQSLSEGEVQIGPYNSSSDTELSVNANGKKKKPMKKKTTPVIVTMTPKKKKVPRNKNLNRSSPNLTTRSPLRPNTHKGLHDPSSDSELSSDNSNQMVMKNKNNNKMKTKTRAVNQQMNMNRNPGGMDTQSSSEEDRGTGSHNLGRSWDSPRSKKNRSTFSDQPTATKRSPLAEPSDMNRQRDLYQSQPSKLKTGGDGVPASMQEFTIVFDNPRPNMSGGVGNVSIGGHSRPGGRDRNAGSGPVYNGPQQPSSTAQGFKSTGDMTIVFDGAKPTSDMKTSKNSEEKYITDNENRPRRQQSSQQPRQQQRQGQRSSQQLRQQPTGFHKYMMIFTSCFHHGQR